MNVNAIRKLPTHHIIILVKTISKIQSVPADLSFASDIFCREDRGFLKSLLNQHREGLIIGSACEAGELYQAILNQKSPQAVARLAEFYDYYEIQPLGNNQFMIDSDGMEISIPKRICKISTGDRQSWGKIQKACRGDL